MEECRIRQERGTSSAHRMRVVERSVYMHVQVVALADMDMNMHCHHVTVADASIAEDTVHESGCQRKLHILNNAYRYRVQQFRLHRAWKSTVKPWRSHPLTHLP